MSLKEELPLSATEQLLILHMTQEKTTTPHVDRDLYILLN